MSLVVVSNTPVLKLYALAYSFQVTFSADQIVGCVLPGFSVASTNKRFEKTPLAMVVYR